MENSEDTENVHENSLDESDTNTDDEAMNDENKNNQTSEQRNYQTPATSKQTSNMGPKYNGANMNDLQPIDYNSADRVRQAVKTFFRRKHLPQYSEKIWRVQNNLQSSTLMEMDPFEPRNQTGDRDEFDNEHTERNQYCYGFRHHDKIPHTTALEATTSKAKPLSLDSNNTDNNNFNSADIMRQAIQVFGHGVIPSDSRNLIQDKSNSKLESYAAGRQCMHMMQSSRDVRRCRCRLRQPKTAGKRFWKSRKRRRKPRRSAVTRRRRREEIISSMYIGRLRNVMSFKGNPESK